MNSSHLHHDVYFYEIIKLCLKSHYIFKSISFRSLSDSYEYKIVRSGNQ